MPWACRAENLDFVEKAPYDFLTEADLPAPPERVFEVFADVSGWPRWFDGMRAGRWISAQQGGVGAVRHMTLDTLSVDETILAWEPGVHFAFRIDTVTLPLIRAMVEDYRLERRGEGTHLVWRAAYDPSLLTRLLHPIVRFVFGRQFKRTAERLRQLLQ